MRAPSCSAGMSFVMFGARSHWPASSDACATGATSAARASAREKMNLFILVVPSMRREGDAVGHALELAQAAPPRHQEEEAEEEQGAQLRPALAPWGRLLHAQVTQDQEHAHEHAVHG